MGMLDRYKKKGGFSQLLSLIETFQPNKKAKFLDLIHEENPVWSNALKEKVLSVERILSWDKSTLAEIVPEVNLKTLAIAIKGFTEEQREKLYSGLPHAEKRKIEGEAAVSEPNANEIATTHVKLIEAVRQMITSGQLRIEKIDQGLLIDEQYEESLLHSSTFIKQGQVEAVVEEEPVELKFDLRSPQDSKSSADLKAIQSLLLNLQRENKVLKGEVKLLKDKLEQIRKIA